MVNGGVKFLLHALDLSGQQGDARFKLADRQRIEILLDQQRKGVDRAATGKKVVRVHGMNVDPMRPPVNKH